MSHTTARSRLKHRWRETATVASPITKVPRASSITRGQVKGAPLASLACMCILYEISACVMFIITIDHGYPQLTWWLPPSDQHGQYPVIDLMESFDLKCTLYLLQVQYSHRSFFNPRPHMGGGGGGCHPQVGFVPCTPRFLSWRSDFCYNCFLNLL